MRDEAGIVYAFAASSSGEILSEAGDRSSLPEDGVVAISLRPESVRAFHEEIHRYRAEGPEFVPRLYGQGRSLGAIDSPVSGIVVFAFGIVPVDVASDTPVQRVSWMSAFRNRVKSVLEHYADYLEE